MSTTTPRMKKSWREILGKEVAKEVAKDIGSNEMFLSRIF